jgi:predicted enzyme related to lactoylglutathione lyase
MSRVIHFEINADEPERAVQFYTNVFGWKINRWDGPEDYWLVTTGESSEPGIDGAIQTRTNPNMATVNTIGVDSLDQALANVQTNGGVIVQPKTVVPGVGYWAMCLDSEGNPFGMMQENPQAS